MKDNVRVAVVNMHSEWGNKSANVEKYEQFMKEAHEKGAELILFPEMSLTSYDDVAETKKAEKMQVIQAEEIPGKSSLAIAELAKKYQMYVVWGMPEMANGIAYNSACAVSPDGEILGSYRKIHLPFPETNWAERGTKPFLFDTPWGPVGITICYDTYCFPELFRYYAAKGCRLILNPTAIAHCHGSVQANTALQYHAGTNGVYVASSNLVDLDLDNIFWGNCSIIGPGEEFLSSEMVVGTVFSDPDGFKEQLIVADCDLTKCHRAIFSPNPNIGGDSDYAAKVYKAMMEDLI